MCYPKVKIKAFDYSENNFNIGNKVYSAFSLIEHSKQFTIFKMPLSGIDLSNLPWGERININSFCYHVNRINKADLSKPILFDEDGYLCDGWHRVVKAITNNIETLPAIRLETMPEPCEVKEDA